MIRPVQNLTCRHVIRFKQIINILWVRPHCYFDDSFDLEILGFRYSVECDVVGCLTLEHGVCCVQSAEQ